MRSRWSRRAVEHRAEAGRGRKALALALLCLAQFMVILDTTIVNVALPSIQADLGFGSQAGLQYVISLYALCFGGSLILAGRVADLYGRRRAFAGGLVAFALSSLACGLAPTPGALLAARAVQGLGAALVSSAALALLTTLFAEGAERNRALGAWGAVGGAAGASGLILGGALTGLLGWPWVFFINVPIGLGAALGAPKILTGADAAQRGRRLDLPGALSVTLGLGLLIFGLTRGEQDGFTAGSTLGLLVAAVVLLVAFVVIERRVARPLVAFRLFRVPGVAAAEIAALLLTTIIASNLFFTTLYVQEALGFTPLQTGLAFLPNSVLVVIGSATASRLASHTGPGPILIVGFAILLVAGLLLSGVSVGGSYLTDVLPGFALTGLGLGMAFVAVTIAATQGVDDHDQGLASGVVNSAQQVGFAVGIAAVVAAALAVTETGSGTGGQHLVAGYSVGYVLDAGIAALGVIVALVLTRAGPGNRTRPPTISPGSRSTPSH